MSERRLIPSIAWAPTPPVDHTTVRTGIEEEEEDVVTEDDTDTP
jgi:hypothetical protein